MNTWLNEKVIQKTIPKTTTKMQLGAPKWGSKCDKMAIMGHGDFWTEVSKKLLVPRCPQDASGWLQIAQDSLQDSPRLLPIAQDKLKLAQKGSQGGASWAKMGQDCSKVVPTKL